MPVILFLFPYAGGGASSLRVFAAALPVGIQPILVTLPGRGGRFGEEAITDWRALIEVLYADLSPIVRQPYALLGHSLGALVALELAHRFRDGGHGDPVWFGASGCVAPARRAPGEDWLNCEEAHFIERLRGLDGTPAELLENRDLLELCLPALRADFHLASSYLRTVRPPLRSHLLILAGEEDDEVVVPVESLAAWRLEVSGMSRIVLYPGGHFFINDHSYAIARECANDIVNALMLKEAKHA